MTIVVTGGWSISVPDGVTFKYKSVKAICTVWCIPDVWSDVTIVATGG